MTNDDHPGFEPHLEEAAGLPLDETDEALLGDLAQLLTDIDPVTDDLVSRIQFSLALDEVYAEVAELTRMPADALAVRYEPMAGERTGSLTFSAERLTAMVTVTRVDDELRMDGWVAPAARFLVRAYRLALDVTSSKDAVWADGDRALRQVTHRFLADAPGLMESFKFNVVIARLMDLVNVTRKAIDSGPGAGDPAVREAVETIALGLSVFAPYTGEEMWEKLGHEPSVGLVTWRSADPALLVEDTATVAVQVGGKVRATLEVPAKIGEAELEALARADERVQRALEGKEIVRVIVRAPKIVNFAVKG